MHHKTKQLTKQDNFSYAYGLSGMVIILLLVFLLGAYGLNADVIWFDELTSVGHMGVFDAPYSPAQIVDSIATQSAQHMPLYFLWGAGWAELVGWSQFALRSISLFAGVLFVAWSYRFGSDFFNRRTGFIAALFLSTSAFMSVHFHEIRMYSMLMLFTVIHAWLYWRLAHREKQSRIIWIFFILTTTALFYTHIFSTVLFAGLGIYHLLFVKKSRHWLNIILGWGIGALLFAPYIPVVITGFSQATTKVSTFTTALSTPALIETFIYLLTNGIPFALVIFAACLMFSLWQNHDRTVLRWIFVTGVMFLTLVLINAKFGLVPLRRSRYLLILWFPMFILFAYGLASIPYWKMTTLLFAVVWSAGGWHIYQLPSFLDAIGTIEAVASYPPMQHYIFELQDKVQPQDYVLGFTDANYVNHAGKHDKSTADYYLEAQLGIGGAFIPSNLSDENLEADFPLKVDNHPYLLFTYNPMDKPIVFDRTLDMLTSDYIACDVMVEKPDLVIQRYVYKSLDCDRDYEPIVYDNGIRIVDKYATYDPELQTIRIVTGWEVEDEQLLDEYNVSLQLVTGDWQNVGQTDRHLYDDLLKWYVAELSTADLPPDDYRVMIIVYHRDTGEKVTGTDLTSGETGTLLPITVFTIEK